MIYKYVIESITNITNKVVQLTEKINNDLEIVPNLINTTVNINQTLSIEFDSALSETELVILLKLVKVNINEHIPGLDFQIADYNSVYRSSFESNINPSNIHDIGNFYVPGSMIVNKNENKGYMCIKNDLNNAVWKKMDCPEIVKNIDDTISISLEGNTYNTVSIPPISTGKYVLEVDTNETKWKIQDMGPTGPIGETGPTGATGPTGPMGATGIGVIGKTIFSTGFRQNNNSPFINTGSSACQIAVTFSYGGTSSGVIPGELSVVYKITGSGTKGQIKLYDSSTNLIIATISELSSTTPTIATTTTFNNLPLNSATIELQYRVTSGSGSIILYSLQLV